MTVTEFQSKELVVVCGSFLDPAIDMDLTSLDDLAQYVVSLDTKKLTFKEGTAPHFVRVGRLSARQAVRLAALAPEDRYAEAIVQAYQGHKPQGCEWESRTTKQTPNEILELLLNLFTAEGVVTLGKWAYNLSALPAGASGPFV